MTIRDAGSAAYVVRSKMLGVLLRDARQTAVKTNRECAEVLGLPTGAYNAYELGQKSPSLPELELLAFFLDVPLKHFWGEHTRSDHPRASAAQLPSAAITQLRDRIIGAQLRKARMTAKIKMKDLADQVGLASSRLSAYEFGERPIPLPDLEALVQRLNLNMEDLLESHGTVGEWDSAQRAVERLKDMPSDLRDFVTQPANEHYLRLAHKLSELPADKLRGIAESLLEITY
jgi:transcriptional regulator with XRE-family HTH domain